MPRTLPPLPTRVALLAARKVAGNPAAYLHEPDFTALINTAWWALKADQLDRIERDKTAAAIRSTFPEDAA
ncbi:hypothetical protein [Microcystis phage Mae-JY02]